MTSMQALRFNTYGGPEVLSIEQRPVPVLNPGEVLVKIEAAAINPSDVKIVGGLFGAPLPRTPGRDFAGTVVVGDPNWVGKEVWGSGAGFGFRRDGAHAEYVAVAASWLSVKPASLTMAEAAAIGAPFVTASVALERSALLRSGETVLITGALGAVGQAATQIAKWRGAKVIGVGRSARAKGFDGYINVAKQDLTVEVLAMTGGKGVDVVLDAVGGALFEPALKTLAHDGRHIAITSVGTRRVEFDLADFYHKRLRLIGVDTASLSGPEIAAILDNLRGGFDGDQLVAPSITIIPLRSAIDGYRNTVSSGTAKQVISFS